MRSLTFHISFLHRLHCDCSGRPVQWGLPLDWFVQSTLGEVVHLEKYFPKYIFTHNISVEEKCCRLFQLKWRVKKNTKMAPKNPPTTPKSGGEDFSPSSNLKFMIRMWIFFCNAIPLPSHLLKNKSVLRYPRGNPL